VGVAVRVPIPDVEKVRGNARYILAVVIDSGVDRGVGYLTPPCLSTSNKYMIYIIN
jgi:hypothetical protein